MKEHFTNTLDLNASLAEALNMISPDIEHHHQQTAYMAYMIARAADLDDRMLELVRMAALGHDLGFITMEDPGSIEELERDAAKIAETGAKLIEGFPDSAEIAAIVRFCQSRWTDYLAVADEADASCRDSARMASIVHLADAVSTSIRDDVPVLNQVRTIREAVKSVSGSEFSEEAVDAFLRVSENEYIWMDLRYNPEFLRFFLGEPEPLSLDRTVEHTVIMSRIIDYRSSFTAMHSAGVAAAAVELARLAGMSEDECKMMKIAGHMHDIGKLKVPRGILEKPGRVTEEEFNIIKEHPYYTRLNMMNVEGFGEIANWAGFHHEKLSGSGYPFHLGASDLDTGSRIMAVADIFSAVTEERPYRKGMDRRAAMEVLADNVHAGGIDGDLVALLEDNYETVDSARDEASRSEGARYFASISNSGM